MEDSTRAQKVFEEMIAQDHFSKWMGIELLQIEEGYCKLRMQVRREMLNGYGMLHGGVAFSFADSAFAFGSNSYGRQAVSISSQMSYSKSAKEGDFLVAEASALNVGHKLAEFDVEVFEEKSQEIYYRFRGMVYRSSREVGVSK
ncbi:MAG: hotdog fold thioesterase [Bacteroidota bacterium]